MKQHQQTKIEFKKKKITKKNPNKPKQTGYISNYLCEAEEAREAGEYLVKYQVLRKENTRLRK